MGAAMGRATNKLSDAFLRTAKHSGKTLRADTHSDGGGLYFLVSTAGGKSWQFNYAYAGKQKTLRLGAYPALSAAQARKARDDAKALLVQGIDPNINKRAQLLEQNTAAAATFEAVTLEMFDTKRKGWSEGYADKWMLRMRKHVFPELGSLPIASITAPMLLSVLRVPEGKGHTDTAHRLKIQIGQVFDYAIQTARCEANPIRALSGALQAHIVKHYPALTTPAEIQQLLLDMYSYVGRSTYTSAALALSALLFQRPGNIRQMQWGWIDWNNATLTIPAKGVKDTLQAKADKPPHVVPLSRQAIAILRNLEQYRRTVPAGVPDYVFPSERHISRCMSDGTLNGALKSMGYGGKQTPHGFRATAKTTMLDNFANAHYGAIEAQLAHSKKGTNPLGAAYDRAQYMRQRVQMMQEWADYLDVLKDGKPAGRVLYLPTKTA